MSGGTDSGTDGRDAVIDREIDRRWPEHAKLRKIAPTSQAQGELLVWLYARGIALCVWSGGPPAGWEPIEVNVQDLLAQVHGLDRAKIAAEKESMLPYFTGDQG